MGVFSRIPNPLQTLERTLSLSRKMRSVACVAFVLGLAGQGCRAFLAPPPPAAAAAATGAAYHSPVNPVYNNNNRFSAARCRAKQQPLRMMAGDNDEAAAAAGPMPEPAAKSPSELMEAAQEADYVARASAADTSSGPAVMGPAKPDEAYKRKERESFELNKPKDNKWASGAFKRGLALQVCFHRADRG